MMTRTEDFVLWISALIALCTFSCESDNELRGQLVISIETDMAAPDELDHLYVQVLPNGRTLEDLEYELGNSPRSVKLPATLTLLAGEDPALPVTVRVAASKDNIYRTFREVTTTVPYGRLTHLPMPLQWLCDETAEKVSSDPRSKALRSTCSTGQSCVAGKCVKSQVSARDLRDFSARNIYGGADRPEDGKCFDTLPCMITGSVVTPDADCRIERPQWNNVNVALRVARGGICDDSKAICFVPLDGDSKEGWLDSDTQLQLPTAVCDKLKLGVISGVYVSTYCATKTAADPPCGAWSSVTTKRDQEPPANILSRAPKVELITQLDRYADGEVCCPLLMDDAALYTCACTSPSESRVLRINPHDGSKARAFDVSPPADRKRLSFGATLADGALFWVSERTLARVSLDGHESQSFSLSGDAYEQSSLLSDDSTLMVLANRPERKSGAPVQVLRVSYAGTDEPLDTGGNFAVYQFAQRADAIYVATDVDKPDKASGAVDRSSTVVQIDKRTGMRTQLVTTENLVTTDVEQGGYLGVQMGTDTLYALFEAMPNADGTTSMQVRAIDPSSSSKTYDTIYEQPIDSSHTRMSMLGVVDDTPILARTEYTSIEAGSGLVRSTSIFAVTARGEPPVILADLAQDSPLPGLAGDEQRVYLITKAGALFGIARAGLP